MEATPPAKCAIGFYIMHCSVIIALTMLVKPNNLTNIKHFFTANSSPTDQAQYLDTNTHHLTSELSNLNLQTDEYTGSDYFYVGNGAGLNIHHTGASS